MAKTNLPVPTSTFQALLLPWYKKHGRTLPWRGARSPYHIWVSEVMLQQTQVETVKPYYRRWLKRFPTLKSLAQAEAQEVLQLWQGLGYYARARNFHQAAQKVLNDFGGRVPSTLDSLRTLSGVGRYTAAAIASIAFGVPAAVLDGNVKRVLARVFNLRYDVKSPQGEKKLWALAQSLLPPKRAGDYNQAVMDLGATICKPQTPLCVDCPLKKICQAYQLGNQAQRPVTTKKKGIPHYEVAAGILRKGSKVLIAQRPAEKLLGGLWEFPGGKQEAGETLEQCLQRELKEELGITVRVGRPVLKLRHTFSHFKISLHVFRARITRGKPQALEATALRWVAPKNLADYPMGKTDRQIADWLNKKS